MVVELSCFSLAASGEVECCSAELDLTWNFAMLSNILLMLPNLLESDWTFDVDDLDDNFPDDDELGPSNFVILLLTLLVPSSWNFLFRFIVNSQYIV